VYVLASIRALIECTDVNARGSLLAPSRFLELAVDDGGVYAPHMIATIRSFLGVHATVIFRTHSQRQRKFVVWARFASVQDSVRGFLKIKCCFIQPPSTFSKLSKSDLLANLQSMEEHDEAEGNIGDSIPAQNLLNETIDAEKEPPAKRRKTNGGDGTENEKKGEGNPV
jgi:hypothetical protein